MAVETNAFQIAGDMYRVADTVGARVLAITRHAGALLQARVRANASGRPGPRIITGEYFASWTNDVVTTGDAAASATVGTDQPQGRRLEFGFTGVDSIGRKYHQPPYPHVGPAVDEVTPVYVDLLKQIPTLGGD